MLATLGAWSFGAMIVIAAVIALATFIQETWPGSVITKTAPEAPDNGDSERPTLGNMRRALWRQDWFGRLGWLGMWCGFIGAFGLFIGVPWTALEERARRESREAVERELVRRQCGDLLPIPPSKRVLDGIIRDDPEVTEEVARRWRQYFDCRDRALEHERFRLNVSQHLVKP